MNYPRRRVLDVVTGLLIAIIALVVLGQVLTAVLMQYMIHMIIAGTVVVLVWIALRVVIFKRSW